MPSTQAVAFDLAEGGAPDRTVVLADHQTQGRGRRGRRWEDEPGTSLLVSILLRPHLEPPRLPLLSYAAAVAVAEALEAVAPLAPRLKWPNDVLVSGRKIAGILLESRLRATTGRVGAPGAPDRSSPVPEGRPAPPITVLGVGVNLGQRRFPPPLAGRATSVALLTGQAPDREAVLAALLERFDAWRARLESDGFAPVRERWLALSETIGHVVRVDGQRGRAVDLAGDGALVLETPAGRRHVMAGALGA